jgi:hypothetical protein
MNSLQPDIRAELVLNTGDQPEYIQGRQRKHYRIKLTMENVPQGVDQILLELHSTYPNPIREARREAGFVVDITSYGDYVLNAQVPDGRFLNVVRKKLSDALLEAHARNPNPAVEAAIQEIKDA